VDDFLLSNQQAERYVALQTSRRLMNGEWTTRFTDDKGNPVSHEAFETYGFTQGLKLPGQM